ncbi:MAG: metallophosphoesterase [Clostridia bacterium]|nr:metallophosphoesterase [Clostridia bacterium]
MKILHTADMHLGSPLNSKLSGAKVRERSRELTDTFRKIVNFATREGASAIIIAGDLFDCERVSAKIYDEVTGIIEGSKINFFYLPGNHEGDSFVGSGRTLPKNLYTFGEEWTYFELEDTVIGGRSLCSPDLFSTYRAHPEKKNIAVLHGELRDRSASPATVGLKDARGVGLDYLALGHYHGYRCERIDERGVAVYCGAPECRGFDECGEHGYVVIDTEGDGVTHRFVPSAVRELHIVELDVTGALSQREIEDGAEGQLSGISAKDMVRLRLSGKRKIDLNCDTDSLYRRFCHNFYYFEVKDSTGLEIRAEDYAHDKSLKGEFLRCVLSDESLTKEERDRIITCGLYALAGEALYDK